MSTSRAGRRSPAMRHIETAAARNASIYAEGETLSLIVDGCAERLATMHDRGADVIHPWNKTEIVDFELDGGGARIERHPDAVRPCGCHLAPRRGEPGHGRKDVDLNDCIRHRPVGEVLEPNIQRAACTEHDVWRLVGVTADN